VNGSTSFFVLIEASSAIVSRVVVGADLVIKGASGVLTLAKTNKITATVGSTAPQLDVGDNTQATGSPAIPSILSQDQTNVILMDFIGVGPGKTTAGSGGDGSSIPRPAGPRPRCDRIPPSKIYDDLTAHRSLAEDALGFDRISSCSGRITSSAILA
jgi:hypothetical protein